MIEKVRENLRERRIENWIIEDVKKIARERQRQNCSGRESGL